MFSHSRVMITGGNYLTEINHNHLPPAPGRGIDILKSATAPAAFHNSRERERFDPPKCHPHTREAVLEKILAWVQRKIDTESFVMWLYGAAGAGKSAIAQSIAEICYKHGLLLATFFFARSDANRNNSERLVATLAYQMIRAIPESRALVEASIENDPLIFDQSLETQFTILILRPLEHLQEAGVFAQASPPSFIILDGLDECMDGTQTLILDLISTAILGSSGRRLVFLVASRPEQDISTRMRSREIEESLATIALDTEYQSDEDIERFLRDKFDDIKKSHPLRSYINLSWPGDEIIKTLLKKSSGQFIYASTAIKYMSSTRHRPTSRLDVILGITPPRNDTPFAQLDELYMHIISSVEDVDLTIRILTTLILTSSPTKPLAIFILEHFLDLAPGDISLHLSDLSSLIDITDMDRPRVLHASLGDFLFDRARSQKFCVNPKTIHNILARNSLQIMATQGDRPIHYSKKLAFSLNRGPYHIISADVTPELADDLHAFPLNDLLARRFCAPYFRRFSAIFILCLEEMEFEGAELIHSHQRSLHDKAVISHLDQFPFSDVKMLSILTDIGLVDSLSGSRYFCTVFEYRLSTVLGAAFGIPAHSNGQIFPDSDIIRLSYLHDDMGRETGFLHRFFADETRSERYSIDGETFAAASTKCIQHLHRQNLFRTLKMKRWAERSKSRPWLWRKRNLNRSVLSHIRSRWGYTFWANYTKPLSQEDSYAIDWIPEVRWSVRVVKPEPLLTLFLALLYIPPVLERAASSPELVALIKDSTSTFRLSFLLFPRKTRAAKGEITKYILRVQEETARVEELCVENT